MNGSIEVLERELDEALNAYSKTISAPPRVEALALMLDRERARARGRRGVVAIAAAAASLVGVGAVAALGSESDTVVVARAESPDSLAAAIATSTVPPLTTISPTTAPPTTIDVTPPSLSITSPGEGAVFAIKAVMLTGMTEPGAKVRLGELATEAAADGAFAFDLTLAAGANRLVVHAADAAGNVAEAGITVSYNPPPPPTTKPEPPPTTKSVTTTVKAESSFAFTMNQKWYKCETNPPFEEFYGTAAPGSTVTVASSHGGGSVTVDAKGKWYLKVEFPTAPKNVYFEGTVSSPQGTKPFRFKYLVA